MWVRECVVAAIFSTFETFYVFNKWGLAYEEFERVE